jgi:decaprenylphospho-beta-D-erythro-pentofuranosid-2-ulose 2-reductase
VTTVAVLGATSGIAHAALRLWAERGAELRLVARDRDKLDRVEADLVARGAASLTSAVSDLGTSSGVASAVGTIFNPGPVDVVLIAFGTMPSQAEADSSPEVAAAMLEINGPLNVLAAHLVALRLLAQGRGSLAVIGSVAGDRGRKSNYLYGSSKAMIATAASGLQHRTAGTDVKVTLIKPGPTATPMTDHLRGGRITLAKAETVAGDIVRGIDRGRPVVYTPRTWALIMQIIRLIPRKVFERSNL